MPANLNFQVSGQSASALFSLKLHRGEGMTLIAMNWKNGKPSNDFVGFAIEYKEPGGEKFFPLKNRVSFPDSVGNVNPNKLSTLLSPIQKFRWVHFPRNANMLGLFTYRVSPVFMNIKGELSYGEYQQASIALMHDTYPGQLNVSFTRGFVASQAFVDFYQANGETIATLLPPKANQGSSFVPTHTKSNEAYQWMGFEAREKILEVLRNAVSDASAKVYIVAYDLNIPEMVNLLKKLKGRLKIIIDDDGTHGKAGAAENQAADELSAILGAANVKRQHMAKLQHNKTIIVESPTLKTVVCGSTNYSWRGFYVQANNAIILQGQESVNVFKAAFNDYWLSNDDVKTFSATNSALWNDLKLTNIDAKVTFSPHDKNNAVLDSIATDIASTKSSLFYSLAFLSMIKGKVRDAITQVTNNQNLFVYGISDKKTGGFDLLKPDGNMAPVFASALTKNLPEPFKTEATGGIGTRMHHKFVVIDFDKPTARVYMGSYNFSDAADRSNGENLLCIKDRKVATAYMIEALRTFDHYHFRIASAEAKSLGRKLMLAKPPTTAAAATWFDDDYTIAIKIKDRELFA
ncbi:MAG: phospholipase, partial [Pedobacter sp.]